jgi:hypothetical protein
MLARLHGRVLQQETGASDGDSMPQSQMAPSALSDADLQAKLAQMQSQIATLQAQLTDLAIQLLKEREQHAQQLLLARQPSLPFPEEPMPTPLSGSALCMPDQLAMSPLACHPTEKRHHLIPLIEYGA